MREISSAPGERDTRVPRFIHLSLSAELIREIRLMKLAREVQVSNATPDSMFLM